MDLPEHGEIASYIGSLVGRKKKGITAQPQARAPPVSEHIVRDIQELDVRWGLERKRITKGNPPKTRVYSYEDIYDHLLAAHVAAGRLGLFPFPALTKVQAIAGAYRKSVRTAGRPPPNAILR